MTNELRGAVLESSTVEQRDPGFDLGGERDLRKLISNHS